MIVNHEQRFVFVHIPKVAGTSIRSALRKVDGCHRPEWATTKHLPAEDIISRHRDHGIDVSGYLFFGFVRNPWDRFASLHRYLHKIGRERHPDVPSELSDFPLMLADEVPWVEKLHSTRPQCDFLRNAKVQVGRYERLADEFALICNRLGISPTMRRRNATLAEPADYRPLYSERAARIIEMRYAQDIEQFGYTFEPGE